MLRHEFIRLLHQLWSTFSSLSEETCNYEVCAACYGHWLCIGQVKLLFVKVLARGQRYILSPSPALSSTSKTHLHPSLRVRGASKVIVSCYHYIYILYTHTIHPLQPPIIFLVSSSFCPSHYRILITLKGLQKYDWGFQVTTWSINLGPLRVSHMSP